MIFLLRCVRFFSCFRVKFLSTELTLSLSLNDICSAYLLGKTCWMLFIWIYLFRMHFTPVCVPYTNMQHSSFNIQNSNQISFFNESQERLRHFMNTIRKFCMKNFPHKIRTFLKFMKTYLSDIACRRHCYNFRFRDVWVHQMCDIYEFVSVWQCSSTELCLSSDMFCRKFSLRISTSPWTLFRRSPNVGVRHCSVSKRKTKVSE